MSSLKLSKLRCDFVLKLDFSVIDLKVLKGINVNTNCET